MKIGKLAKAVGCTVETIRFYEQQGLLPPVERGENNFRSYTIEHLERLSFIRYCRSLDISLDEIKQLLSLDQHSPAQQQEIIKLLEHHIKDITKRIHELDHLRMRFIELRGECAQKSQHKEKLLESLLKHQGMRIAALR
ncbi:MerR family transcriptional regulator [Bisgaard Taxon 45]|uniref:MerR family transcriptional regulator n=1 Tax=Bisgaard Taxon 45 TaxID=304289 RepID=A0ABT9KG48_9PAST|nr:MerR family transcriptional regulator [Bisgaard Taxon 45]